MAMNDKVEFDLVVNGKKAKKSIDEVEKGLQDLEKQDEKTAKTMKADWVAIGAGITAASLAMGAMAKGAMDLEKATFGLNEETKNYIRSMSELHGLNQEIIAGFVQTGKSAGMSGDEIAKMVDMAVALGRKFPHESTESFIDNLSMLNRTGEAQGYIVDVLEQKWGAIDLKTKSTAEKMAILEEATAGVNEEFRKTKAANYEKTFQAIRNSADDLGLTILELGEDSGILWLFNKTVKLTTALFSEIGVIISSVNIEMRKLFGQETTQELSKYNELLKKNKELWAEFRGEREGITATAPMITVEGKQKPPEQKIIEETQKLKNEAETEDKRRLQRMEAFNNRVYSSMGNEIANFVTKGKMDFKSLANSIISDLMRMSIQKSILGIFGAGGGPASLIPGLFHTGGTVGGSGTDIPSYHTGMRSDERLAKLQVGESVVNRAGTSKNAAAIDAMNRGQKIGGSGEVILNIENNTGSAIQAEQISSMMQQDGSGETRRIINIVMEGVNNNINGSRDFFKGF